MKYGAYILPTQYSIRPDELAIRMEERGFESLFLSEHSHIPASCWRFMQERVQAAMGGELPTREDCREYWSVFDPFTALMSAAAATKSLRIGTGICLLVQRDPIQTAKQVATLDVLSNGRFIFGIGGGWIAGEMENHGTEFKTRWRLLQERLEAAKEIWTKEEASYKGEFVNFDRIWCDPKPVQKPYPPILMASTNVVKAVQRMISCCDGWIVFAVPDLDLSGQLTDVRRAAELAGRSPESLSVTVFGAAPERQVLNEYEKLGVDRVVFRVPSAGIDIVEPLLDHWADLDSR